MKSKLSVLMWKHFLVRKKRYILSSIEILSPAFYFILLFVFKNRLAPQTKLTESTPFSIRNTEPLSITSAEGPQRVFYTPQTDLTDLIMENVGKRLSLQQQNVLTEDMRFGKYYTALKNESDYQKYSSGNWTNDAIVIFQELRPTGQVGGEKLNYTIRMKGGFHTETYKADSPRLKPNKNFGATYESFMKLQWAIDTSYLELVTGYEIPQRVMLQEFPYVRLRANEMAKYVCEMIPLVCWLSLLLAFVFLTARLVEERISGIQELIKMVGVPQWLINTAHVLNVAPVGLVFSVAGTTLLAVGDQPVIPKTNPGFIFIALVLHFATVVSIAFAISYLVRSQQYMVLLSSLAYIGLIMPGEFLAPIDIPMPLMWPCGLLPQVPLRWFCREMAALEESGEGITMGNIAKVNSAKSNSVLASYIMSTAQCAVLSLLAWYLSLVLPGPYGQALPFYFLCQTSKKDKREEIEELDDTDVINPKYFEAPPPNAEAGIKVANVTKIFGQHRALRNVSMDVYKGEITVLLGHNGAGKTTLMSIITGMYSATEGNVYIEGMDTVRKTNEMRKLLGLCPQHNLFFLDLTVLQHVMFFSMLKGIPHAEAKESSMAVLERVSIADKASFASSQLSGGMKRRLQLACALTGNSRVLVLDEPTSGLDVETRRGLWDLLLSLRGSRTVLISTHFMEEAEALGDRVAALHAGRLRCHATPMYLKRALGTGYRLTLSTKGMPNEPAFTAAITSRVPDAVLREISLNSISYNLPSKDTAKFPKLFNLLESKRSELEIENIGVGESTLEEVFLQLGSDVTTSFSDEDGDLITEPTFAKLTGPSLYVHQLVLMVKRQYKYFWSKKISFLIQQLALPIVMICLLTHLTNGGSKPRSVNTPLSLKLDMYKAPDRRVLYNVNASLPRMRSIGDKHPKMDFQGVPNVTEAIVHIGERSRPDYNKYLFGIEFNEFDAKVLYTSLVRHAAPVALNLLSNVMALQLLPHSDGDTITTLNHPLGDDQYLRTGDKPPKSIPNLIWWSYGIVLIYSTVLVNYVALPCTERVTGTRHIHVMSGCPPALHWIATLLSHFTNTLVALLLPTVLAAALLDQDDTINRADYLVVLSAVVILGVLAYLPLIYLVSFSLEVRGAVLLLSAFNFIFILVTPVLEMLARGKGVLYYLMTVCSSVMPLHSFMMAVFYSSLTVILRAEGNEACYMCFAKLAPLSYMLKLSFQSIAYMTLVVLTEYGVINRFFDRINNSSYKPTSSDAVSEKVKAEKAYVDHAITLPRQEIRDAMLASNLHKRYWSCFSKPFAAVQGVDFSVKKGECFGLLGVNGAGKSSTFKMLTGIECATRGTVYADGHFISQFSSKYLQSLGYCPQFFGLDDFLSGHDNLALLLTLRGLSPADVEAETNSWIEIVGLQKYASRAVSGYSGGCSRRLAAAAALCCGGAVTLLDEPTAGVDVAARRRVWAAVRRAARSSRSIIITSHSLDEIEALCRRIAIMSAGRIVTLGSAAELRAAHASGHAVHLKLAAHPAGKGGSSDVEQLKAAMERRFDCTLRDEHRTMLHYHINVTMRYSELFAAMEDLRAQFPNILEDYTLTETTLEEVFLSFAKGEEAEGRKKKKRPSA